MRTSSKLLIAGLCILSFAGGCGKKGMPQPKDSSQAFTFARVTTSSAGDCLTVQGKLQGTVKNVEAISLELEAIGADFNCPTCPFRPSERQDYSKAEAGLLNEDTFSVQYCPRSGASSYRWRMIGKNVFQNLDYAVSPTRIVDVE